MHHPVSEQTQKLLVPLLNSIPGEVLLKVVLEANSELAKRTALRLIFEKGKWESLPLLIRAADHHDESVATSARTYIEAWFSPPLCNRVFTKPSSLERREIEEAISARKESLPRQFLGKLLAWLNEPWVK